MFVQDAYLVGFDRKVFSLCGVELAPLTLGHVALLAKAESAAIFSHKEFSYEDIVLMCAFCQFPSWGQAIEICESSDSYLPSVAYHVAENKSDKDAKDAANYLQYYLERPASRSSQDVWDSRVPWWWSYAEFLQTEMGRSELDAWNTICADAFCYYASYATRSGSEHYITMREAAISEQVKSGKTIQQLFEEGAI